ncbi:recombinase family protein [Neotabrizicola shimadae]|uniref:recombinase family protein n=1 Tax=Neotabrizicola shimadae TaxID=2807096 RepID=UPI002176C59F|nr:recombinase family protein [Neotabrizicola shimadae]
MVQRIFAAYDAGKSARTIAIELNREGIPAPRSTGHGAPGTWSFSTISGNWKRGTGILNNELYIGRMVWNRQSFVKDPETGKRQSRPNPPEAWVTEDVPHLRIIEDGLWERVKRRQGAIRDDILAARAEAPEATGAERGHRARYLFSGLLTCGCCGSGYIMISATRYGCAAARNSGICTNRKTIARSEVETRVLEGLKHHLLRPDMIATFLAEVREELQKERLAMLQARSGSERRLHEVNRSIAAVVDAIAAGMFHPSMKAKMDTLEDERARLEAELSALPAADPVALHPGLVDIYARKVERLADTLNAPGTRTEATEVLRSLIERIVLHPEPGAPGGHAIELFGELGAILSLCGEGTNARARTGGAGVRQVAMVAGAGFEPAAFRL